VKSLKSTGGGVEGSREIQVITLCLMVIITIFLLINTSNNRSDS
jgi:hypothetical protein